MGRESLNKMNFLFLLLSILVFFLQFYSPFTFLVSKLKIKLQAIEVFVLSLILGLSINASFFFFGGYLLSSKIYYLSYIFLILGLINIKNSWQILIDSFSFLKKKKNISFIILLGIFYLFLTIALSGFYYNGNLVFEDGQFHDSMWHIALIRSLLSSIPPVHPSSFSYIVSNYHYFWDINIASMVKSFSFDTLFLYYQLFAFVTALLLGLSGYVFIRRLSRDKFLHYIFLFLLFFGGNFGYLIPVFFTTKNWSESSFWVSQTFSMMVNPQLVFSFSCLLTLLFLIKVSFGLSMKLQNRVKFLCVFLIASSLGFKSYGFLVMASIYLSFLLFQTLKGKIMPVLKALLIFVVFSLPYFYLIVGFGKPSFIWEPLWYLSTMVEAPDRLNVVQWKLLEQHYLFTSNWPRLIILKAKEFLIFFIGNLGTRFFVLFAPFILFIKKTTSRTILVLTFIAFIFSSFFPLLFLQKGVVWNSIQFWYYSLVLGSLLAAYTIYFIFHKLKKRFFGFLFLATVFIATVPAIINFSFDRFTHFKSISGDKISLLQKIEKGQHIYICPQQKDLYNTALVAALSRGKVYMANTVQLEILGKPFRDIEKKQKRDLGQKDFSVFKQTLDDYEINYLLCSDQSLKAFFDQFGENDILEAQDWYLKKI